MFTVIYYFCRMATVLRKGHTLKGKSLLPLIRRIKDEAPDAGRALARTSRDIRTEDLTEEQLREAILGLTGLAGDQVAELLDLAGRPHDVEHLRRVLHYAVVIANEQGQKRPAGPTTQEPDQSDLDALQQKVQKLEDERMVEREETAKAQVRALAAAGAGRELQLTC